MTSNFRSNGTDLDNIFAPRGWFNYGNGLWSWGDGAYGGLGLNSLVTRSSPTVVGTSLDWQSVSGGNRLSFAIKKDWTLWAWGRNSFASSYSLGLNDRIDRSSPTQVGSLANWKSVSSSTSGVIAVKTDGTLWAWGAGTSGVLGLNSIISRSSPVQVGALTNWRSAVIGTLATKTDGTLWSWGGGANGVLGLNSIIDRSSPVQVGALTNWTYATALGRAVKTDGTLWSWGGNSTGFLGLNDIINRSSPVQVGTSTNWAFTAGPFAITTLGTLWALGGDQTLTGILGLNDLISRSSPVQVGSLTNWKQVSNSAQALAVKTDGTLWSWGSNVPFGLLPAVGLLGQGNNVSRSSPTQVGSLTGWTSVSAGVHQSFALKFVDL
jgi:alpha-tubulin suppressor-like RCC1 family protein